MKKYVSLDKRSKKAQKEFYSAQRRTWGELSPVTRSVPNGKAYNRKKEKRRIGRDFENGSRTDSSFAFRAAKRSPLYFFQSFCISTMKSGVARRVVAQYAMDH